MAEDKETGQVVTPDPKVEDKVVTPAQPQVEVKDPVVDKDPKDPVKTEPVEDITKMKAEVQRLQNLEKLYGRQSEELGELRKVARAAIVPLKPKEEMTPEQRFEMLLDPEKFDKYERDREESIKKESAERVLQLIAEKEYYKGILDQLHTKYPDTKDSNSQFYKDVDSLMKENGLPVSQSLYAAELVDSRQKLAKLPELEEQIRQETLKGIRKIGTENPVVTPPAVKPTTELTAEQKRAADMTGTSYENYAAMVESKEYRGR